MSTPNISGKWTGVIIYGKKYREYSGKELYYDAELIQENDLIHGTSSDTAGVGVSPDIASISGSFSSNFISFVKRYESLHYFDRDQVVFDRTQPGYEIYYTGLYDEFNQSFQGNWEYILRYKIFGFIPSTFIAGGTWTMRKKEKS